MVIATLLFAGNFAAVQVEAANVESVTVETEAAVADATSAEMEEAEVATVDAATAETEVAEETEETVQAAPAEISGDDTGLTGDELFSRYVQRQLYRGMIMFSTRYGEDRFDDPYNLSLYLYLKDRVTGLASDGGSAVITITEDDLEEGFLSFPELETTAETVRDDVATAFKKRFAIADVVSALLFDCPYELYWYDKSTDGACRWEYSFAYSKYSSGEVTNVRLKSITIRFQVAEGYRVEEYQAGQPAVSEDVALVSKAIARANQIVKENENLSDMDKLTAYKEAICDLTSYNSEAASVNYSKGYGDPWQLVYVFDGDPSTNVVCEGFAKAFQYLCELSSFDGNVRSYLMTGVLNGGGRLEGHMWNVVSVDGTTYLADLTNSDENTVGANGELFMVTGFGDETGYVIPIGARKVEYRYDEKTIQMYDSSIRVLRKNENSGKETEQDDDPVETKSYTVRWLDEDGSLLASSLVVEGERPMYEGEKPSKEPSEFVLYKFDGWNPAVTKVSSDADYTARYREIDRWVVEDNKLKYRLSESEYLRSSWLEIQGEKYYFDDQCNAVIGWKKLEGDWYYFDRTGEMQTGWAKVGSVWYYMGIDGKMQTGWRQIGGLWYYFAGSGAMKTGWLQLGGNWYYMNSGGNMQTGWKKIGGSWYYFAGSGAMKTGWLQLGGKWYYFNPGGNMQTGWKKISGSWYYMDQNGAMVTGSVAIGGKTYRFNSGGVCLNP